MEVYDAQNNLLAVGDKIYVIKDLKVKGMPKGLKRGDKLVVADLVFGEASVEVRVGKSTICIKPEYVKKT